MKVLVIIPAYNEEKSIVHVVQKLKETCPDFDYIVIDDCSTDGTLQILKHKKMNYVSLPINLGIGGGVQLGYQYAYEKGYDIAVQMDGDGQHDPRYLNDLIVPIINGETDMSIGSRFIIKEGFQTSLMRRFGITILRYTIQLFAQVKITDATSGFRACTKELIYFFAGDYAQDYPEPEAIVAATLNGFSIAEVPVEMIERIEGVSSINWLNSIYYMIKVNLSIVLRRLTYKHSQKSKDKKRR